MTTNSHCLDFSVGLQSIARSTGTESVPVTYPFTAPPPCHRNHLTFHKLMYDSLLIHKDFGRCFHSLDILTSRITFLSNSIVFFNQIRKAVGSIHIMIHAMGTIVVCSTLNLPGIAFINLLEPMANCFYNYFFSSQRRADPMVY